MIVDDITVEVRNKALQRKGIIAPEMLDLKAVKRHLNVGEWHLTLPREHAMVPLLWTPGSGIIITLRNKVWMSGPTSSPAFEAKPEDPAGSITFSGVDDKIILADALCWPLPSQPDVTLQTDSHDVRTGPAETVMKQYVNANIGPGAPLDRRGTFAQLLDVADDLERGPAVTKSARFPNLLELLGEIGLYANMGFDVVQQGLELIFDVYEIRDLHDLIRFDIDNGTLEDETVQISAPTVTRPIVAGQGEQEERTFIQRTSVDSLQAETDWGRKIEQFIDQRNTNDPDELNQAGDEALAEDGFTAAAVKAVPADDLTREYITDWDIGDMVTVEVLNQPTVTTVTEAALVANSSGITVAAAIGDVSGFDADSAMGGRVDDTARRVAAIEKNLEVSNSPYTYDGICGEIRMFGGSSAPPGWALCDGTARPRTDNLFSVIGTTYGAGNGSTTYTLPNFKGRVAIGVGDSGATGHTNHTLGSTGGEETHTMTTSELVSHQHEIYTNFNGSQSSHGHASGGNTVADAGTNPSAGSFSAINTTHDHKTLAAGSGAAANNMPPFLTVNYIIKL